jgi:hypothetical protein
VSYFDYTLDCLSKIKTRTTKTSRKSKATSPNDDNFVFLSHIRRCSFRSPPNQSAKKKKMMMIHNTATTTTSSQQPQQQQQQQVKQQQQQQQQQQNTQIEQTNFKLRGWLQSTTRASWIFFLYST